MSEANRSIRVILISFAISLVLLLPASGRAIAQAGDKEPNNSPGQATAIPLPCTTPGEISSADDIDFYKFSVTAGQEIIVWLRAETGLYPTLSFYDGNGKLLAYNDLELNLGNGGEAEDPILYLKIPSSGYYIISISSGPTPKNEQGGGTGGYTLSVFQRWYWALMSDRHETNDTLRTAAPITLPFDSVVSDLTYLGDVDWYEFSALAGDNISIDIEAIESAAHSPWLMTVDARVGVFDDGKHLLQEALPGRDPDSGFAEDPATIFKAPRDGKYYIAVTTSRDVQYRSILNEPSFLADPYVSSADHLIGSYLLRVRVIQDLFFPQIANGSFGSIYFKTSVILVNPGDTEVTGSISFSNADGTPMEISNLPSQDYPGHCWFHIPPKGDFVFVTDGEGPGTSGYARVQVPGSIGGSAIFSEYAGTGELITEAAVAISPRMEFFTFPVDVTGDFNTGVAIANPEDTIAINVYLNLLDLSGTPVAQKSVLLNPGSQIAIYVSGIGQLFPGLQNFRGSLQVLADLPWSNYMVSRHVYQIPVVYMSGVVQVYVEYCILGCFASLLVEVG